MIRNHTPEDRTFIAELAESAFGRFGPFRTIFENMLDGLGVPGVRGEMEIFVHKTDAGIQTGFIAVEWSAAVTNIHGVAVAEEFRRQGVSSRLLDHVVASSTARGVTSLKCITAETENMPALSFFQKKGFANMGFAGKYPNGQKAVGLKREIGF